ncbi:MAG: hypothetical protein COV48_04360 [Elusimicrobia bacterium CG11_big_fil_rev_8_21_14_0_20_64_6]|nr:MAG: hypothetical protein COV48_04360 [Elusimicrobia bacterium CG11_big_fil_rev_8_21_14_0_20_64_6]
MILPLLLLSSLSGSASALNLPDCIHVSPATARPRYKLSLDAVRDCQERARKKLIDAAQAKGRPLSYRQIEEIDDLQRAEAREYLEKSGTVIEGTTKSARSLGGVTKKDRSRISADEGAEVEALEKRLHAAAKDGRDGITPAMGRDILDSLEKRQGSVSPDMRKLVDAVVRDGGKLTPETMKLLQNAGRAAKSEGLDLNIDKDIERDLLEHDFDTDKDAPPAAHADPGNL